MSSIFFGSVVAISIFSIFLSIYVHRPKFEVIQIEEDNFWKKGEVVKDDDTVYSYKLDFSEKRIQNFKEKLKHEILYKSPNRSPDSSLFFQNLTKVLLDFDWKQHQHFLNTFKQYRTEIEGLNIHFLRVSTTPQGKNKKVVPILILHGFPGSFWDFFKIIPILSNPSRHGFDFGVKETIQFDVIIPSLPGFMFSDKPEKEGFDATSTTRIIAKLMQRLDLNNYFIHGSQSYGNDLATLLASLYPNRVLGLHLSNPFVRPTFSSLTMLRYIWSSRNDDNVTDLGDYFRKEKFSYPSANLYTTSLINSPLGTAAFIAHRWKQLSTPNASKDLHQMFTIDEIATEVYLHWLTDSLSSSIEILDQSYNNLESYDWLTSQVSIPTAIAYTKDSPWICSRDILEDKYFNVTRISTLPKGGVFHHLQDPNKISQDIFSFVELQYL